MTQIRLVSTRSNWDGILATARQQAGQIVRKTAFDAQAQAQENAPVDTGALKASIYTVSAGTSGFAASAAAVQATTPPKQKAPGTFPEYQSLGAFTAVIVVGVEYGYFVETGTARKPARPFLLPAVEAQQGAFVKALQRILSPTEGASVTTSDTYQRDAATGTNP